MVTKAEFNEAVENLDNRLTAVESKIGGIHRIDDEAQNVETRRAASAPSFPTFRRRQNVCSSHRPKRPHLHHHKNHHHPTSQQQPRGMFRAGHGNQLMGTSKNGDFRRIMRI
jgi:hypothetical protein